jgi:hypothetical protein
MKKGQWLSDAIHPAIEENKIKILHSMWDNVMEIKIFWQLALFFDLNAILSLFRYVLFFLNSNFHWLRITDKGRVLSYFKVFRKQACTYYTGMLSLSIVLHRQFQCEKKEFC